MEQNCVTASDGSMFCRTDTTALAAPTSPAAPDMFHSAIHFLGGHWFYFVLALILFWAWSAWFGPTYAVWAAHMGGRADLARAQNDQQIQIAEANSRLAAAEANKKAAIVEAEAVAEQIKIIGDNVKNHPLYLTWQWVKMMEERDGATIYVPTEANLPILEAGKRLGGGVAQGNS